MPKRTDPARDLAFTAARVIDETRGADIVVLDLRKVTTTASQDAGTSPARARSRPTASVPCCSSFTPRPDKPSTSSSSMRRSSWPEVKHTVRRELHDEPRGVEGYEDSHWIVMDYGDVVVHLFDAESRAYWDLENLWADASRVAHPAALTPAVKPVDTVQVFLLRQVPQPA